MDNDQNQSQITDEKPLLKITNHDCFKGKSLVRDPETGFLVSNHNYTLSGFTPERKKGFIEALKTVATPSAACRIIGIHYHTFQNHYKKDPDFRKQVDYSLNEGRWRQKGEFELAMIEHGKKINGFMWAMAWLRKHFPGEYSETKQVVHSIDEKLLDRLDRTAKTIDVQQIKGNEDAT